MDAAPSGKDTWQEKLDRALTGDTEAFGDVCQNYLRAKLYPMTLKWLRNPDDAEDIVQAVFVKLLTNSHRIRKHSLNSFEAFVVTMAKNACRDFWRTQKMTLSVGNGPLIDKTTQQKMRQKGIREELRELNSALSEVERTIFHLRVEEELTFQEIAARIDVPLTTIHYRYQKILEKIDQCTNLRTYWEEINRE